MLAWIMSPCFNILEIEDSVGMYVWFSFMVFGGSVQPLYMWEFCDIPASVQL